MMYRLIFICSYTDGMDILRRHSVLIRVIYSSNNHPQIFFVNIV